MRLAIKMDEQGNMTDADLDAPEGSLKVMQHAVMGQIERVPVSLGADFNMWVNEDGLRLMPSRHNSLASTLMVDTYGGGAVFGPVIFTSVKTDDEDGILGLTPDEEVMIRDCIVMER